MTTRQGILIDAQRVIERAKSAGRPMTDNERKGVRDALARAKQIDRDHEQDEHDDIRARLSEALRDGDAPAGTLGRLSFAGLANRVAESGRKSHQLGTKALLPAGTIVGNITTISDPVAIGKPLASLLAALPTRPISDGPTFSYLRQTSRDNNAAPVVPGAEKPVSTYGLIEVRDELSVVAHVSEEVPKYWFEDDAKLQSFLDSELRYGLAVALEEQIVSGDGVDPNLRGFANTSGIVAEPFNVDPIRTARSAISSLLALGANNDGGEPFFVFGVNDWETIETASLDSGEYVLSRHGTPVDAAERRLWGQPVVLAPNIAAGTGWLVDPSAVELVTDGQVRVEWNSATGFSRNTVIARCETRAALAVKRPAGIAKLTLTGP